MIDFLIFIASLVIYLFLLGWVLSLSARAVRSPRGSLRLGLLTALLIVVINVALAVVGRAAASTSAVASLILDIVLFAVELWAILLLLRKVFRLSFGRAFVPLGAVILYLLGAFAISAWLRYSQILDPFEMSTGSMIPTINPGDHFLANGLITPRRWDLVAYRNADEYHETFCKRLVGFPGEQLRFSEGSLIIDGKIVTAPAILAGKLHMYDASVQGEAVHYRDDQTITLGGDEYFFVGDNIKRSADSRYYGPSKRSSIVGMVDWIYWPLNHFKLLR